jgi:hypothetical protein
MILQWNTGGSFTFGTGFTLSTGVFADYAGTFAKGGNAILYINGIQQSSDAFGASAPTSTATSLIQINSDFNTNTRNPGAIGNMIAMWNRALSAQEILWLHLDPYQLIVPLATKQGLMSPTPPSHIAVSYQRVQQILMTGP